MDRRKALAAAAAFAVSVTAAGTAMAANLGLLQVGTQVDPVGKLDVAGATASAGLEVPPVPTTAVPSVVPPSTEVEPAEQSPPATEAGEQPAVPPSSAPAAGPTDDRSVAGPTNAGTGHRSDDEVHAPPVTNPTPPAPPTTDAPPTTKPRSTTTTTRHKDDDEVERDD